MITERTNPGNAQLSGRDTFACRYSGQWVYELEVVSNVLWG